MKKRGFTLMEMLIVMAVIAILIAIAIPAFRGMQDQANKSKAEAELKALKVAVESYYMTNKSYPAAATDWQTALTGATPKLIETALVDPFGATSTTQYGYSKSPNGKYYAIYSAFPSGKSIMANNTGTPTGDATVYVNN